MAREERQWIYKTFLFPIKMQVLSVKIFVVLVFCFGFDVVVFVLFCFYFVLFCIWIRVFWWFLFGSEDLGFLNSKLSTFSVWYEQMLSAFSFQSNIQYEHVINPGDTAESIQ